ncbi:hypothetical protein LARV_00433 [Longilinea arvoryzae]|uniref:Uncharacterized protein n=1 Tax=Longilinea arvoryzae TaxID=360412 RepID=A0A0S7BC24_9CHLR|nr:hypothetical protein [Longilinea arvoryzae]GAP12697.1 hypothetical protein LARV_00433 [Longilinea arvoryzae]
MIRRRILALLLGAALLGSIFSIAQAASATPGTVFRRYGIDVIGALNLTNLTGRPQTPSAVVQTASASESYYVFPAVSSLQVIDSACFYILNRSGNYSGSVTMTLDIYGIDGSYHRTISSPVDLTTAATGTWLSLDLSGYTTRLTASEYPVVHFVYSNGAGGTLDIRPIFEIRSYTGLRMFLPLVGR